MVAENPTWGTPRIHEELKMLGFDVPERAVLRWMRRAPGNPLHTTGGEFLTARHQVSGQRPIIQQLRGAFPYDVVSGCLKPRGGALFSTSLGFSSETIVFA